MRFTILVFVFLLGILSVAHLSNSHTPYHEAQDPVNYFDDSSLSTFILQGMDYESFRINSKWGWWAVYPGYVLYNTFGILSPGRRVIAYIFVIGAVALAGWQFYLHGLISPPGLLCFVFLSLTGAEMSRYASFGLVIYPFMILMGTFLAITVIFTEKYSPWARTIIHSLVMMAAVFVSIQNLVAVWAFAGAVCLYEWSWYLRKTSFKQISKLVAQAAIKVVPATGLSIYMLLLETPEQFNNPRSDIIHLYPFHGAFTHTPLGLASFFVEMTGRLFSTSLRISPNLSGTGFADVTSVLLGLLAFSGLFLSLVRPKSVAFVFAAFFCFGMAGHFLLSALGHCPYGDLRYFLVFYCCFPLFAVIGLDSLTGLIGKFLPRRRCAGGSKFVGMAPLTLGIILIIASAAYAYNTVCINEKTNQIDRSAFAAMRDDAGSSEYGLVFDEWTARTLIPQCPSLLLRPAFYELSTSWRLRSRLAGEQSGRKYEWLGFLSGQQKVYVLTSMPFCEENYGQLFKWAEARFHVRPLKNGAYWFFVNVLEEPKNSSDLLANQNPLLGKEWLHPLFTPWPVDKRFEIETTPAPSGIPEGAPCYKIMLAPGTSISHTEPLNVGAGTTIVAEGWFWVEDVSQEVNLRFEAGFMDWANRARTSFFSLGKTPQKALLSHVSTKSDTSALFALVNLSEKPLVVYLAAPRMFTVEEKAQSQ